MKATIISHSKPYRSKKGLRDIKDLIAFCARVSNPTNQLNEDSDKLLAYLAKHYHWSPFEMVSCCIEVETTRDIARQLLRHRSFSFQEFSQRYANPNEMGDAFTRRETRLQDPNNRQASIECEDEDLDARWQNEQEKVLLQAKAAYRWALDNGIAKEQARVVLPEGMTKSRMYVNGTIRSWMHYLAIRTTNDNQKEHRELALAIAEVLSSIYPTISTKGETK